MFPNDKLVCSGSGREFYVCNEKTKIRFGRWQMACTFTGPNTRILCCTQDLSVTPEAEQRPMHRPMQNFSWGYMTWISFRVDLNMDLKQQISQPNRIDDMFHILRATFKFVQCSPPIGLLLKGHGPCPAKQHKNSSRM